jgi:glutaredoxin
MKQVKIYARANCHLCEVALATIESFLPEYQFEIEKILIDGKPDLEQKYGEQVPVILINDQPHDFFRVDPVRFRKAIS